MQTKTENLQIETESLHIETGNSEPEDLKVATENLKVETENVNSENTIQSEIKFSASDFNFLDKAGTVEEPKVSGNFLKSFLSKSSGDIHFFICTCSLKKNIVVNLI